MSDGEIDRRRPAERNTSWLHSEPARFTCRPTPLNPIRIVEQVVIDIREKVRQNLEAYYSSESFPEPELHPNENIEREFPFDDIDPSIINHNGQDEDTLHPTDTRSENTEQTESRVSHRGEFSLTSYDSSIFNPKEIYSDIQEMATQQQNTSRGETTGEHRITRKSTDLENHHTSKRLEQSRICQKARDSVLDQILDGMRGIQDSLSRLENASHDHYAKTITQRLI